MKSIKIISYFLIIIGFIGMVIYPNYLGKFFTQECTLPQYALSYYLSSYIGHFINNYETVPYIFAYKKNKTLYASLFIWNNSNLPKLIWINRISYKDYKETRNSFCYILVNQRPKSLVKVDFELHTNYSFFYYIKYLFGKKTKVFVQDLKLFRCFRRRVLTKNLKNNNYYFSFFPMSIIGGKINKLIVNFGDTVKIVLYFPNPWVFDREYKYYGKHPFYDKDDTLKFYLKKNLWKKELYTKTKKERFIFDFRIRNKNLLFPSNVCVNEERKGVYKVKFEVPIHKNYDSLLILYVASHSFDYPYDSIIFEDTDTKDTRRKKKIYIYYESNIRTIQNIRVPASFDEYVKGEYSFYYVYEKLIYTIVKVSFLLSFLILLTGIILLIKYRKTKNNK